MSISFAISVSQTNWIMSGSLRKDSTHNSVMRRPGENVVTRQCYIIVSGCITPSLLVRRISFSVVQ